MKIKHIKKNRRSIENKSTNQIGQVIYKKTNLLSIVGNLFFAFVVCPILAFEFFYNFMPFVLNFSLLLSSIIFSISLMFILVPFLKTYFILKNISTYFFRLQFQKKTALQVQCLPSWSNKVYKGKLINY